MPMLKKRRALLYAKLGHKKYPGTFRFKVNGLKDFNGSFESIVKNGMYSLTDCVTE